MTDDRVLADFDSSRLLVTPEEAATMLSIGRSKIYDLIRAREIRSVRIGGSRRISVSALHEFICRLEGPDGDFTSAVVDVF